MKIIYIIESIQMEIEFMSFKLLESLVHSVWSPYLIEAVEQL